MQYININIYDIEYSICFIYNIYDIYYILYCILYILYIYIKCHQRWHQGPGGDRAGHEEVAPLLIYDALRTLSKGIIYLHYWEDLIIPPHIRGDTESSYGWENRFNQQTEHTPPPKNIYFFRWLKSWCSQPLCLVPQLHRLDPKRGKKCPNAAELSKILAGSAAGEAQQCQKMGN